MSTAAAVRPGPWRRELLLFAAAYVAYSLSRGAIGGSLDVGIENARAVIELQTSLGIGVEAAIQEHLIGQPVMWLLNRLYLIAQFAVVPLALVWVYRRRRRLYPVFRTTVLATWVVALPVYALYPTAPPRLADIGVVDTVSQQTPFALDSPAVMAFYNPVAAIPSLHAGFAIAVGIAVAASVTSVWLRALAVMWGPVVGFVVIATGNHFVLDIVFGLVAVAVGYGVAVLIHRDRGPSARLRARAASVSAGGPLRVALLCPYDWNHPGGVRTHVAGLASALRARGNHVEVIAAGRPDGRAPDEAVTLVGGTTALGINGSLARIAITPVATWRVWRALRRGGYDVVHLHEPVIPMVCWTGMWVRRSALVATFHAYHPTRRPYRLARPLFGALLNRVPTPLAVSPAARDCASAFTRHPIAVVPNGITPPALSAAPTAGGGRSILFIGRNDPRKGLSVLLDAVAGLPADVRLDVVGVAADELGDDAPVPDGRVTFHGRVGDAALGELLREADVLCAPSLSGESFGIVLAEATAHGVPVVASDITGYREVLRPGFGMLVPPGDPLALAAALDEVLSDPELRARTRAKGPEAVAALRWEHLSGHVETIYRRAVRAHAADARPERAPMAEQPAL